MRRFLVVGCGGSGGSTLAYLMDQLRSDLEDGGVQRLPKGWQFVHIDVPTGEDKGPEGLRNVQQGNGRYLGLGPQNGSYQILDNAVSQSLLAAGAVGEIGTWAPRNPDTVMVPLAVGAGQSRALGRMITLSKASTIAASLNASWQDLQAVDTLSEMATIADQLPSLGPFDPAAAPIVLVVGSMAGGSGASMTLDVCRLLSQVQGVSPGLMGIFMVGADVFDSLPQASRPGVRPNAAAMFGEIVASQVGAARAHDVTTLAALGLADGAGAHVPFARVFPVGRLMGVNRTPFGSGTPAEIFRALGRGLGSLMASPSATAQFVDWDLGNVTPPGDQDPIGWGLAGPAEWNPLPWAGFGFASLSMGRDRYGEYAAQRLAHEAVERLMRGHLQPGNTTSAEAQMAQLVDSQWTSVIGGFGLPETRSARPGEQDHGVNAWWTSVAYPSTETQAAAEAIYDGQLQTHLPSADGNPANSWKQVLDTTLADRRRAVSEAANREAQLWAFRWQHRLVTAAGLVIQDAIARHGLPFAKKLLERLDGTTREVATQIAGFRSWTPPDVTALSQDFSGLLPKKNAVVTNGRPLLDRVRQEMLHQIRNFIWGAAAAVGSRVLNSFAAEVLPAMSAAVSEAQRVLEAVESEPVAPMGLARVHTEQVAAWPKRADAMVNTRFDHAVNEVLLTTSAQYQGQFVADLVGSLPADIPRGVPEEAMRLVVRMIISGIWPTTGADNAPGGLVEQTFPWSSRVFNVNPTNGESLAPAEPRFDIHTRPREILERARMYVKRPNESFDRFCQVSLRRFVAATGALESQLPGRLREVESKFRETLSLALPLVGVNDAAVQAIHGHQVQYRYKFSNIPFDQHPINERLAHVVQIDSMIDPSTLIAYSQSLNTDDTLKRIDVFGSYENFSPIVFESVLQPAAQQWGQTPPAGRKAFWEWRRARPLPASIPMTDVERRAMAAGWLLGQIVGLIRIPDSDPTGQPVRVYDRTTNRWTSFPFPLLTPPTEFYAPYDWFPAILESVLLAISTAHQAPVLSSMRPYQLLRGIFDDNSQRPATGIVHSSASRLIPQWLVAGGLAGADRSRVPGLDRVTTVQERAELARDWLYSVQELAEEFLPAVDGGAPGGKSFSLITSRVHAAATPLFRDVAADVYWATQELAELFVAGERVAHQLGTPGPAEPPSGPPVPPEETTPPTPTGFSF